MSSLSSSKAISVLGLGQMGHAIASVFIEHGYRTYIWNRTPSRGEDLVAQGAVFTDTSTECIRSSPLSILCVNTKATVEEILSTANELSGHTIVNVVNGSPGQVREISALATSQLKADGYLHAAIMASPGPVRSGSALTLYSGPQKTFQLWQPLLGPLGNAMWLSDDVGTASLFDCSLLSILCGVFSGFLQSVAMVGAAGHSEEEFARNMVVPLLGQMEEWLVRTAQEVEQKRYTVEKNGSPIRVQLDSTNNVFKAAAELNVSTALLEGFMESLKESVRRGEGQAEISSIVRLIRDKK